MPKTDPIEKALSAISQLRHGCPADHVERELRGFLNNRSNLVIAKAATVAGELHLRELIPALVGAFERVWTNPAKLDKRCAAMTEIVSALYELDYIEPDLYRRAIQHVQKEGSFGPPVDTAAKLRGISAQGLLRSTFPGALAEVVNLLVDSEAPARLGAIRALISNGGEAGTLLLRLKVLTGDDDPEIISECFSGMLDTTPQQSLTFVAKYIDADDEAIAEAAIWALGQSRQSSAVPILKDKWERTANRPQRKALLGAFAASRLQESIDFLCSQLRTVDSHSAEDILGALANFGTNESVKQAIAAAVKERNDPNLTKLFKEQFGLV